VLNYWERETLIPCTLTKREDVMDFADIEDDQLRTEAIERYVVWIESLPYRVGRAEQDSIRETIINDLEN
jgi:hypothetical protein